jgi:hypothetical protein
VAVVLVGFDDRMVERTGIAAAFPGLLEAVVRAEAIGRPNAGA